MRCTHFHCFIDFTLNYYHTVEKKIFLISFQFEVDKQFDKFKKKCRPGLKKKQFFAKKRRSKKVQVLSKTVALSDLK